MNCNINGEGRDKLDVMFANRRRGSAFSDSMRYLLHISHVLDYYEDGASKTEDDEPGLVLARLFRYSAYWGPLLPHFRADIDHSHRNPLPSSRTPPSLL